MKEFHEGIDEGIHEGISMLYARTGSKKLMNNKSKVNTLNEYRQKEMMLTNY